MFYNEFKRIIVVLFIIFACHDNGTNKSPAPSSLEKKLGIKGQSKPKTSTKGSQKSTTATSSKIKDEDILNKLNNLKDNIQKGNEDKSYYKNVFSDYNDYTNDQKNIFCRQFTNDAASFIQKDKHELDSSFKFLIYNMLAYTAPENIRKKLNDTDVEFKDSKQKFGTLGFAALPSEFANFTNLLSKEGESIEDNELNTAIKTLEGKAEATSITGLARSFLSTFTKKFEGGMMGSLGKITKKIPGKRLLYTTINLVEISATTCLVYYLSALSTLGNIFVSYFPAMASSKVSAFLTQYLGKNAISKVLSSAVPVGVPVAIVLGTISVINRIAEYFCLNPLRHVVKIRVANDNDNYKLNYTDGGTKMCFINEKFYKVINEGEKYEYDLGNNTNQNITLKLSNFNESEYPKYIIYKKGESDYVITTFWTKRLLDLINIEKINRKDIYLCYQKYSTKKLRWLQKEEKCILSDIQDPYCYNLVEVLHMTNLSTSQIDTKLIDQEQNSKDPINTSIGREDIRLFFRFADLTEMIPEILKVIKSGLSFIGSKIKIKLPHSKNESKQNIEEIKHEGDIKVEEENKVLEYKNILDSDKARLSEDKEPENNSFILALAVLLDLDSNFIDYILMIAVNDLTLNDIADKTMTLLMDIFKKKFSLKKKYKSNKSSNKYFIEKEDFIKLNSKINFDLNDNIKEYCSSNNISEQDVINSLKKTRIKIYDEAIAKLDEHIQNNQ